MGLTGIPCLEGLAFLFGEQSLVRARSVHVQIGSGDHPFGVMQRLKSPVSNLPRPVSTVCSLRGTGPTLCPSVIATCKVTHWLLIRDCARDMPGAMRTCQLPAFGAAGQQLAEVKENAVDVPGANALAEGSGGFAKTVMNRDMATWVRGHSVATPASLRAPTSKSVSSLQKKLPAGGTDFFETCKWGHNDEDAAEFQEYLVWKVQRDYPGLSPQAFEKKVKELDAIEKKKSQEREKVWLKNIYEGIVRRS